KQIAVSDRTTLEGLTQLDLTRSHASPQPIGSTRNVRPDIREGGFCATLVRAARNSLILRRRDVGVVDRARLENVPTRTQAAAHARGRRFLATSCCLWPRSAFFCGL